MNGIRTILAVALGVVFTIFAVQNWTAITVDIFGTPFVVPLPLLLLGSVLVGVFPTWVWATARRMHWKGRATRAEGRLGQAFGPAATPVAAPASGE